MDSKIAVIIPTFNRPDSLELTLRSLMKQTKIPEIFVVAESTDSETAERFSGDARINFIMNMSEPRGSLPCTNRLMPFLDGYDVIVGGDDLIFRYDCIATASQWMEKCYPNHFGMIGLHQATNKSFMIGAFSLIGHALCDHFPGRMIFCPDYKRIYCDWELRQFARSRNCFANCRMAVVKHEQNDDETHLRCAAMEESDEETYRHRKLLGYAWGTNFDLINSESECYDNANGRNF